jgi:hypothetical protein
MLVVLRIFMMGQTTPGTLFLRVIIMRWTLGSYITINTTVGAYCISLKKMASVVPKSKTGRIE